MLVFATSDKGGTGRSVTSCNLAFRAAVAGRDVCYVDFDFASPTAGAIFRIDAVSRGTGSERGTHSLLQGRTTEAERCAVWTTTDREGLRERPRRSGRLVLLPGDEHGGEFAGSEAMTSRCAQLLLRLDEEYDLCLIDLSAGRSYAISIVLAATAMTELAQVRSRWLVFHRWTRQHIIAASGLVYGERGLLAIGEAYGHGPRALQDSVRFVRTALVDPDSAELAGLRPAQVAWLRDVNQELQQLARRNNLGRTSVLGSVPLDPVLQWREQILLDEDVTLDVANQDTVEAFEGLAEKVLDEVSWEPL